MTKDVILNIWVLRRLGWSYKRIAVTEGIHHKQITRALDKLKNHSDAEIICELFKNGKTDALDKAKRMGYLIDKMDFVKYGRRPYG